jgi:hypothetical protein
MPPLEKAITIGKTGTAWVFLERPTADEARRETGLTLHLVQAPACLVSLPQEPSK